MVINYLSCYQKKRKKFAVIGDFWKNITILSDIGAWSTLTCDISLMVCWSNKCAMYCDSFNKVLFTIVTWVTH